MTVSKLWIDVRRGRITAVIDQARFIRNCLDNTIESAQSIIRYIKELKEMVDDLDRMNKE